MCYSEMEMKKLLCSCLAFGVLAGTAPLARAFEPVRLTEEDMDKVAAGSALDSIQNVTVIDTWTQTVGTMLPGGGMAVTSTTISCDSCAVSISSNSANGISSTVLNGISSTVLNGISSTVLVTLQ